MFTHKIKKSFCLKLALLTFIPLLTPFQTDSALAWPWSPGTVNCDDVHVTVKNMTTKRIKVIDLHYYDPARQKWYSEPITNEIIPAGRDWTITRDLEQVNKKKTRISVRYRVEEGNSRSDDWSNRIDQWAPSRFVCDAGDAYAFSVTETTPGRYDGKGNEH